MQDLNVRVVTKLRTPQTTQLKVSVPQRPGFGCAIVLLVMAVLGVGAWWAANTTVLRCERNGSPQVHCRVDREVGPFVIPQVQVTNVVDAKYDIKTVEQTVNGQPVEYALSETIVLLDANEEQFPTLSGRQFYNLWGKKGARFTPLVQFLHDPSQSSFMTWTSPAYFLTFVGYGLLLLPTLGVLHMLTLLLRLIGRDLGLLST